MAAQRRFPLLDRQIKGIGRIQKSYGTDDRDTIEGIRTMVKTLEKTGQWQFLEAIRDGKVTLLEVYAKWHTQELKKVPIVEKTMDFETAAFEWVDKYEGIGKAARKNYSANFRQLLKVRKKFTIQDIPDVLTEYRKVCVNNETFRQFNTTRNSCRALLKNLFDEFNLIYIAVVKVRPLKEVAKRTEKAWTVPEVLEVVGKMKPEVGAMFWTMCLTGCGWQEYQNGLSVEGKGIRVRGTKMDRVDERRNRLVPMVEEPAPMVRQYKRFKEALQNASDKRMLPYDGRRSFKVWCREAGITFENTAMYMGHRPRTTTDRYSTVEMTAFLEADSAKLKAYVDQLRPVKLNPRAEEFFSWQ